MKIKALYLLLYLIFCSLCFAHSQDKKIMDEWFTYQSSNFDGYMHYVVNEKENEYEIFTKVEIKTSDEGNIFYEVETTNEKDDFLTVKSFSVKIQEGKGEIHHLEGGVQRKGNKLVWNCVYKEKERTKITEYPTLDFFSSFFLLTQLDYSEIGRILEFNSMELDELHYKKNHYIEYIQDETIEIKKEYIDTKKITINGDGISGSSYWLDKNNNLIKISLDDYKDLVKCKNEDIDFSPFE